MQAAGNATCGGSRFKAGRSDGRKNDSKNAKGMEMMTCSHGLIKGMASLAHAETYKHTHLQLLIASKSNATFFCNDVIWKEGAADFNGEEQEQVFAIEGRRSCASKHMSISGMIPIISELYHNKHSKLGAGL